MSGRIPHSFGMHRKAERMVRLWQVDAFTDRPFTGNPAAVCWLDAEADASWMQAVAAEMNLAETAFVRRLGDGHELRWFTPQVEVDLCGHATLASAHALWENGLASPREPLRFLTRSGLLTCVRSEDWIELDFPATPPRPVDPPPELIDALRVQPEFTGRSRFDYLVVLKSEQEVRAARPDFRRLREVQTRGIILTASSDEAEFDFVSRFFAPAVGIDEDPVCGSAHCCLTPYWSDRLGKQRLGARQVSTRGGVLRLRNEGDRVVLGGRAVTVMRGELV
jgi:PhzF family phenazine biosynthesis protein